MVDGAVTVPVGRRPDGLAGGRDRAVEQGGGVRLHRLGAQCLSEVRQPDAVVGSAPLGGVDGAEQVLYGRVEVRSVAQSLVSTGLAGAEVGQKAGPMPTLGPCLRDRGPQRGQGIFEVGFGAAGDETVLEHGGKVGSVAAKVEVARRSELDRLPGTAHGVVQQVQVAGVTVRLVEARGQVGGPSGPGRVPLGSSVEQRGLSLDRPPQVLPVALCHEPLPMRHRKVVAHRQVVAKAQGLSAGADCQVKVRGVTGAGVPQPVHQAAEPPRVGPGRRRGLLFQARQQFRRPVQGSCAAGVFEPQRQNLDQFEGGVGDRRKGHPRVLPEGIQHLFGLGEVAFMVEALEPMPHQPCHVGQQHHVAGPLGDRGEKRGSRGQGVGGELRREQGGVEDVQLY